MKLTTEELSTYLYVLKKIKKLVEVYFKEHICSDGSYEMDKWEIVDLDKINISYAFIDEYFKPCYEERVVTLNELNNLIP